ncbi:hypothetical protein [Nonomuraea diastatica]|uniref:Uncharacterized protein n=1 Tax=Nonomuraea diastatica TaxID=1848329 RepID=A0A4R4W8J6_9ACTN|nr:hypothetical protein [Nonomuraea diastatica]TDD15058.1 hypothetical protein E1294_35695 [Nonomuraea diastatica]
MSTILTSSDTNAGRERVTSAPPLEHRLCAEVRSLAEKVNEGGFCASSHDDRWVAQGLTRRRARLLCEPCTVRDGCLRMTVIEEALSIYVYGGSVHSLHGARGGLLGSERACQVKALVEELKADEVRRKEESIGRVA